MIPIYLMPLPQLEQFFSSCFFGNNSRATMAFNQLSPELIICIAEKAETSALHTLSLTSRNLNLIATPILYANITLRQRSTSSFLRTTLENPRLAEHVKELFRKPSTAHLGNSVLKKDDLERCHNVIHDLSASPARTASWKSAVGRGDWHAMTSLLLILLPNLEEVTLFVYMGALHIGHGFAVAGLLQDSAISKSFAMASLKRVSLSSPADDNDRARPAQSSHHGYHSILQTTLRGVSLCE